MHIFTSKHSTGYNSLFNSLARIYYAQIYDGEVMERNMIPRYRKIDNIAGLYDIVNGMFYTNAGTGTFIVGNNVSVGSNTQTVTNEDHTLYSIWQKNE